MMEKKLNLLKLNLEKKEELVDKLLVISEKQRALLDNSSMELEVFDCIMDEQDTYVRELEELNEEADELYQELWGDGFVADEMYSVLTGQIRELIARLTEKSSTLQEKEQISKQKLERYFQEERQNFGIGRRTSKAALDYHKSMNRSNVVPPQFMDQKK